MGILTPDELAGNNVDQLTVEQKLEFAEDALLAIGRCESPQDMLETAKDALEKLGYDVRNFGE